MTSVKLTIRAVRLKSACSKCGRPHQAYDLELIEEVEGGLTLLLTCQNCHSRGEVELGPRAQD